MKRNWYKFQAKAGNKPTLLTIYDDIGAYGVRAESFIAVLRQQTGEVEIEISSLGGSVIEGLALFNGMSRWAQTAGNSLTFTVMGVAASIASMLIMVPGAKVRMPSNTYLMVHKPWASPEGNADELREIADILDKMEPALVNAYAKRSGKTDEDIRAMLAAETWLTADEALAAGFVDEVIDPIEISNSCDKERLPDNIRALLAPAGGEGGEGGVDDADDSSVKAAAAAAAKAAEDAAAAAAAKPFADEAMAALTAAGLQDAAAPIILACADLDQVKARISVAREIQSLCTVLNRKDDAAALIANNKTLAEARAHLVDVLATADESRDVDNTLSNDKSPNGTQPAAVSTETIWAARRKQQGA
jgi:ATP-dependent Clp protease protease subunit